MKGIEGTTDLDIPDTVLIARFSARTTLSGWFSYLAATRRISYSTAVSYLSLCCKIRASWGTTKLDEFEPEDFQECLKDLDGKPKSKGNLKSLLNRLFNKAMLYKMLPIAPSPIGLVEVRDITKRKKRQVDLTVHDARRDAAFVAKFGSTGWHTFRHKYRTLLSRAETPLDVQQKLLRHADIRTTTQYGAVPEENKRKANSAVVRTILHRTSAQ